MSANDPGRARDMRGSAKAMIAGAFACRRWPARSATADQMDQSLHAGGSTKVATPNPLF